MGGDSFVLIDTWWSAQNVRNGITKYATDNFQEDVPAIYLNAGNYFPPFVTVESTFPIVITVGNKFPLIITVENTSFLLIIVGNTFPLVLTVGDTIPLLITVGKTILPLIIVGNTFPLVKPVENSFLLVITVFKYSHFALFFPRMHRCCPACAICSSVCATRSRYL